MPTVQRPDILSSNVGTGVGMRVVGVSVVGGSVGVSVGVSELYTALVVGESVGKRVGVTACASTCAHAHMGACAFALRAYV